MMALKLGAADTRLSVLCLGAHADDIEIGAGGTLLSLIARGMELDVVWCVMSASTDRRVEAESAARAFLQGARSQSIEVTAFRDGSFPSQYDGIKAWFENLKTRVKPDIILTHRRDDRHQDHREICQHTWSTFRNHMILEYEIPKWDGDLGQPNVYVPLPGEIMERKIDLLMKHFATQRSKAWFDEEVFRGLARLRGMECTAPERYAEAFVGRKLALAAP
ncbi:MAG: PIG-L family deacetylase [Bryobacteraceae bacterium]|nr:PIG-L family deacetylase [Bryobacteraceae bacterium]